VDPGGAAGVELVDGLVEFEIGVGEPADDLGRGRAVDRLEVRREAPSVGAVLGPADGFVDPWRPVSGGDPEGAEPRPDRLEEIAAEPLIL
jgi:hypothetical protein